MQIASMGAPPAGSSGAVGMTKARGLRTLKQQAIAGFGWSGSSMALSSLLQLLQLVVLSRLLLPSDFGIMSLILVVLGFANMLADAGLSSAIIQRQDVTIDQLSSLYWLNILIGLFIYLGLVVAAPLIAFFYQEAELVGLVRLAALSIVIIAFGQQFYALLQKRLEFKKIAIVEVCSSTASTVITISCAAVGMGVYSLIFGQLGLALVRCAGLAIAVRGVFLPRLRFKSSDILSFLRFGGLQTGEKIINYLSANLDTMIIGRFFGPATLGLYSVSYQLVTVPLTKINPVVTRVAFPLFSQIQSDESALKQAYLKLLTSLALLTLPLLATLAAVAPILVPAVLGEKWIGAAPFIQVLVIVGISKCLINPSGSLYLAKGRPDIGLYWNIIVALVNLLAFWIAAHYGIQAMTLTYCVLSVAYFFVGMGLLWPIANISPSAAAQALRLPTILSIATFLTVSAASKAFSSLELPPMTELTLTGSTGLLFFVLFFALLDRERFGTILHSVRLKFWRF